MSNNIYLDIDVSNNTNSNKVLSFQEKRNNPIIKAPADDYNLSVVRFNLSTNLVPMFIPKIKTAPNVTAYNFTMIYKNFSYTQDVIWLPQDNSFISPPTQFSINNTYWYAYSLQYWVSLINASLQLCLNGLNNAVIAGGDTLPYNTDLNLAGVFLEYDPTTGNGILFGNKQNFVDAVNKIILFTDNTTYSMLNDAFSALQFNSVNEKYKFNFVNNKGLNIYTLQDTNGNDVPFVQNFSEYPISMNWSPISSFVFGSSLPIQSNQISNFISTDSGIISNSVPLSINILTDLIVENTQGNSNSGQIYYVPTAEYRRVTILTKNQISEFFINVYWKSKAGDLVPILISPGGYSNIKLLFEGKNQL